MDAVIEACKVAHLGAELITEAARCGGVEMSDHIGKWTTIKVKYEPVIAFWPPWKQDRVKTLMRQCCGEWMEQVTATEVQQCAVCNETREQHDDFHEFARCVKCRHVENVTYPWS